MKELIKIAHSPDTDDLFMFYALKTKKLTHPDFDFEIVGEDIEKLNQLAKTCHYDITAISMHAYAHLHKEYYLTTSGSSMAEKDWGPIVVCQKNCDLQDLQNKKIAVPGLWTTAYLVLKFALSNFKPVVIPAEEILDAVQTQKVDAGLIIHEGQIQFEDLGLFKIHKVIDTWKKIAGDLPLPLGGSAVKKSLGFQKAKALADLQKDSILYGMNNYQAAKDWVLQQHAALTKEQADLYLSWYVNDRTKEMRSEEREALKILFETAKQKKLLSHDFELEIL